MMDLTFLIQKAGDREWLPLESPTVEVLEGRYHLMAHTAQLDQDLDIQIRHRYEDDGILQEEHQQLRQQPDTHGNLSLLPNSYLGNGLWTVTCTLFSTEKQKQSQSINLQVLAEDCESISDWEFVEATPGSWPQVTEMEADDLTAVASQINAHRHLVPSTASQMNTESASTMASGSVDAGAVLQQGDVEENSVPLTAENPEVVLADTNQSYVVALDEIVDPERSDKVSLPRFPQQEHSIQLQQSQSAKLPPQLAPHRTAQPSTPQPLDLPSFPREVHWRYIPLNKISVGMYHREVIQKTHNSDIKQAFRSLELQQRFWQTMQQLVDPAAVQPNAEPAVSVFTRTSG